MDVNFHHSVAATGGKGNPAGNPAGKGHGVFAQIEGGNFFDLLFGGIATQIAQTETNPDGTPEGGEGLITGELSLDTAQDPLSAEFGITDGETAELTEGLAEGDPTGLTNPEISAADIANEQADLAAQAAGLEKFKATLESLLQGIPEESRPEISLAGPGQLKKILEELNVDLGDINANNTALIATGLDPAALADLQKGQPQGLGVTLHNAATTNSDTSDQDVLLLSQSIIVPRGANQNLSARNGRGLAKELAQIALEGIKNSQNGQGVKAGSNPGLEKAMQTVLTKLNGEGSTFPAMGAPGLSNLFSSAAWDSVFPEGLDWAQGTGAHPALTQTSTAGLTSLVSHAPQAGQAHPATQVVAATITKVATEGENKNITIKLNPPELGRVEIRMEFGKDKTVKANIIIEKPETHMMLQRDSHMLERALQEAGLDVDGKSLSFDLAQDGNMFEQDGNNNGSNASGGGSTGGEAGDEIDAVIETTMDWHVDPETGITHYDMLV